MYDQHNPILYGYYAKYYASKNGCPILDVYQLHSKIIFQKWKTSTIQFWMDIILNNMLPKMEDQYNPILDGYYTKQ